MSRANLIPHIAMIKASLSKEGRVSSSFFLGPIGFVDLGPHFFLEPLTAVESDYLIH